MNGDNKRIKNERKRERHKGLQKRGEVQARVMKFFEKKANKSQPF